MYGKPDLKALFLEGAINMLTLPNKSVCSDMLGLFSVRQPFYLQPFW